jgi:hypothetical protein
MKKFFVILLCSVFLFSCGKQEVTPVETQSETPQEIKVEGIENEVSTGVEAELSRDLNNLLNDVSNEQE